MIDIPSDEPSSENDRDTDHKCRKSVIHKKIEKSK